MGGPSRLAWLRRRYGWLDRLLSAAAAYQRRYGDHYAAAVTYFSVLAMVPLLMILFAAAGFVLQGDPALLAQLRASITSAVGDPRLGQMINRVVGEAIAQSAAVGLIGLIVALYSGLGWMTNLREAITAQYSQRPPNPPLVRKTASDLLSLVGLGVALALSIGISAVGGGLGRLVLAAMGVERTVLAAVLLRILALLLGVAASWLVFLWILARLPREPVPVRGAMRGALFGAVGFEALKQVGVVYLGSVTSSPAGAAFGPVLGLLVFANLVARFTLFITAWTACGPGMVSEPEPPQPPPPAIIRPVVRERRGAGAGAGLLGAGVLFGWLLGKRGTEENGRES